MITVSISTYSSYFSAAWSMGEHTVEQDARTRIAPEERKARKGRGEALRPLVVMPDVEVLLGSSLRRMLRGAQVEIASPDARFRSRMIYGHILEVSPLLHPDVQFVLFFANLPIPNRSSCSGTWNSRGR